MTIENTVDQMTGIIPVVVTAGVAMKMVDWMGSRVQPQPVSVKKQKKSKDVYNRSYSGPIAGGGNFSNVGF